MTKLTPTPEGQKPLYVVEVQKEANNIKVWPVGDKFGIAWDLLDGVGSTGFIDFEPKLIGTATLEGNTAVTDFDVEKYLEPYTVIPEYKYGGEVHPKEMYWCYIDKEYVLETDSESFASLLRANGCTNTEVKFVILQEV